MTTLLRPRALLALLATMGAAAATPAMAGPPTTIALPGDTVFPESVTSTSDGTIYVGSIPNGGVMKVAPGADKAEPWIKGAAFGTRSIFGVLADEKSGLLWACSNDSTGFGVAGPSTVKGSFLKGFDLKTGEGKVSAQLPGDKTLCNDIAVDAAGGVYVTNSFAPQVLKLSATRDKLDVWATDPLFAPPKGGAGLDGIAFGSDGNLYLDRFSNAALLRLDVKDGAPGKATELTASQGLKLTDALRPIEGGKAFLMIEGRGRLDRVTVSGDSAKIETLKDDLNGPTGVTPTGAVAWVSEGQLNDLFRGGGKPSLPFDLKSVALPTP